MTTTGTLYTTSNWMPTRRCAMSLPMIGSPSPARTTSASPVSATSWLAAAHAADGTIEAVTLDGHEGWYLGVQWHLEDLADTDPIQHGIFQAFVAAAT